MRGLGNVSTAAVLLFGGYRVVNGQTSLGDLAALLLYLRRFFEPVQELSQFYNIFQSAAAALEKLSGVFQEQPAVPEPDQPEPLPAARGEVRFDHVEFRYRSNTPGRPPRRRPRDPGRPDRRPGGRDGRGQDHRRPTHRPLLRPE